MNAISGVPTATQTKEVPSGPTELRFKVMPVFTRKAANELATALHGIEVHTQNGGRFVSVEALRFRWIFFFRNELNITFRLLSRSVRNKPLREASERDWLGKPFVLERQQDSANQVLYYTFHSNSEKALRKFANFCHKHYKTSEQILRESRELWFQAQSESVRAVPVREEQIHA